MIPKRMNLVAVEIKLLAKAGRITGVNRPGVDRVSRRPRGGKIYSGPDTGNILNLKAQIYYDIQEEKLPTEIGNAPITTGHLTMRKTDFDALTIKPDIGDLVTKVSGDPVEYEISEVKHAGFLKTKANLMMIYFRRSREKLGNP